MNFLKKYWKQVLISVLLIVVGVLLAVNCCRTPADGVNYKEKIDSLKKANSMLNSTYKSKSDSIDKVLIIRDLNAKKLTQKLRDITLKYIALRNSEPSHDTVVQTVTVYEGQECIEKMPVIQAQLVNANGMICDLKNKVIVKESQIYLLQKQFERSNQLVEQQNRDLKKEQRKIKWQKVLIIGEAVLASGIIIYLLAAK